MPVGLLRNIISNLFSFFSSHYSAHVSTSLPHHQLFEYHPKERVRKNEVDQEFGEVDINQLTNEVTIFRQIDPGKFNCN